MSNVIVLDGGPPKTTRRRHGTCETCAFWELVVDRTGEGYQSEGLCRRRAPAATPRPDVTYRGTDVDRTGEGYQSEGLCRRRAPAATPRPDVTYRGTDAAGAQGMFAAWPRTFAESDWCGEWSVVVELGGRRKPQDDDQP